MLSLPNDTKKRYIFFRNKRGPAAIPLTERRQEKLKAKKRKFEKQIVRFAPTQIKETRAKGQFQFKLIFQTHSLLNSFTT